MKELFSIKHVRIAPVKLHIATVRVSCGGVCRAPAEIAERVRLIGRYPVKVLFTSEATKGLTKFDDLLTLHAFYIIYTYVHNSRTDII